MRAGRHPVTLPPRERSPSGLWRRTGNAVWGNPSRVRIPPSPPHPPGAMAADACVGACAPRSRTFGCARSGARTAPSPRRTLAAGLTFWAPKLRGNRERPHLPEHHAVAAVGVSVSAIRSWRGGSGLSSAMPFGMRAGSCCSIPASVSGMRSWRLPTIRSGDRSARSWPRPASRSATITEVVNCHLHADHAGQNAAFPGIPIYVQPVEWELAHTTDHTILEWIDFPGLATSRSRATTRSRPASGSSRPRATRPATSPWWSYDGPTTARSSSPARPLHGRRMGRVTRRRSRDGAAPGTRPRTTARSSACAGCDPAQVLFGHDRERWTA